MRDDDALLLDMLLAGRRIQNFVAGMSYQDFQANEMAQSAVIRELQVIGEAARLITKDGRNRLPEIDWSATRK